MRIVGAIGFVLLLTGGVCLAVIFAMYGEKFEDE
jgi:hypothetical protein